MEAFAKWLVSLNALWYLAALAVVLIALFFVFRNIKRLRPYTGQLLLLSAFVLIAVIFFLLTFSFKVSKLASGVSARSMPRLWIGLLLLSAVAVVLDIVFHKEKPDLPIGNWKLVAIVVVIAVLSVTLFSYIGYYISSALFILAFMMLLGERKPVVLAAVPVGWCVFTYFIFNKLLFISLPVGALFSGIL